MNDPVDKMSRPVFEEWEDVNAYMEELEARVAELEEALRHVRADTANAANINAPDNIRALTFRTIQAVRFVLAGVPVAEPPPAEKTDA